MVALAPERMPRRAEQSANEKFKTKQVPVCALGHGRELAEPAVAPALERLGRRAARERNHAPVRLPREVGGLVEEAIVLLHGGQIQAVDPACGGMIE